MADGSGGMDYNYGRGYDDYGSVDPSTGKKRARKHSGWATRAAYCLEDVADIVKGAFHKAAEKWGVDTSVVDFGDDPAGAAKEWLASRRDRIVSAIRDIGGNWKGQLDRKFLDCLHPRDVAYAARGMAFDGREAADPQMASFMDGVCVHMAERMADGRPGRYGQDVGVLDGIQDAYDDAVQSGILPRRPFQWDDLRHCQPYFQPDLDSRFAGMVRERYVQPCVDRDLRERPVSRKDLADSGFVPEGCIPGYGEYREVRSGLGPQDEARRVGPHPVRSCRLAIASCTPSGGGYEVELIQACDIPGPSCTISDVPIAGRGCRTVFYSAQDVRAMMMAADCSGDLPVFYADLREQEQGGRKVLMADASTVGPSLIGFDARSHSQRVCGAPGPGDPGKGRGKDKDRGRRRDGRAPGKGVPDLAAGQFPYQRDPAPPRPQPGMGGMEMGG